MYVRNVSKSVITRRIGLLMLCALYLILTGYILSGSDAVYAIRKILNIYQQLPNSCHRGVHIFLNR